MLKLDNLSSGYNELIVLRNVSLTVEPGEVVVVLGTNGAGKTTLLKTIIGLLEARSGRVSFQGKDMTRLPTHRIVREGLSLVPEGRQLFVSMTVLQNLRLGMYHLNLDSNQIREEMEKIHHMFPILSQRLDQKAGTLSGGEQQMLAISRALLSKPKLLLLDEPSQGLAPIVVREIFSKLSELAKTGISILIVEQNVLMALELASRCYILETGRIVMSDSADNLRHDRRIIDSYLGGGNQTLRVE